MRERLPISTSRLRASIVVLFLGFAFYYLVFPLGISQGHGADAEPAATPVRRRASARASRYSKFNHNVNAHKMDCNSCHKFPSKNWNKVRTGDDAFPDITDYPKHQSCLNCHKQQFFRGKPPAICTICHVSPGPRNSARFPFPNPREIFDTTPKGKEATSAFQIFFPHDKHIDIVTARGSGNSVFQKASWTLSRKAEESCSACHSTYQPQGDASDEFVTKPPADIGDAFWLKKGTFKTTPTSHKTCFTCHSADSGISPAPTDCATCHKLKPAEGPSDFDIASAKRMQITDKIMLSAWRKRDSSATFRHEWTSHSELSCDTCHNVKAMNTLEPVTKKVPVSSCGTCHATATADDGGALNFEVESRQKNPAFQCAKCHIAFGKQPIPESHLKALAAAK
jgi:hypothetical protein